MSLSKTQVYEISCKRRSTHSNAKLMIKKQKLPHPDFSEVRCLHYHIDKRGWQDDELMSRKTGSYANIHINTNRYRYIFPRSRPPLVSKDNSPSSVSNIPYIHAQANILHPKNQLHPIRNSKCYQLLIKAMERS